MLGQSIQSQADLPIIRIDLPILSDNYGLILILFD